MCRAASRRRGASLIPSLCEESCAPRQNRIECGGSFRQLQPSQCLRGGSMAESISLQESVRTVVRTCARVQPGEQVCIAAGTQTMPIAMAIVEAVHEGGAGPGG